MNDLTRYSQQLIVARDLEDVSAQMQNVIPQIGLVAFLFSVSDDFITYLASADPKESGSDAAFKGLKLPTPHDLLVNKTVGPTIFANLGVSSPYSDILHFLERRGCTCAAMYYLVGNEKPYQLLVVGSSILDDIKQENLAPLTGLCEQASNSIDRILLTGSLQAQKNSQEFINSLSRLIERESTMGGFCQAVHKLVQKYFESEIGFAIAVISEADNQINFPYFYEKTLARTRRPVDLGSDINSYIIKNQRYLTWNTQGPQVMEKLGIIELYSLAKSYLGFPLTIENKTIGVLAFQDFDNENRFEQADISFFNNLTPIFAAAIKNLQEKENLSTITASYQTQKKLTDSIFQNAPFQVYLKDLNGKYIRANNAALRRLGVETELDLFGKSDLNLLPEQEGVPSYKEDLEIIESGIQKMGITTEVVQPDGSSIYYTQNKIPTLDETGKVNGLMGVAWDDTQFRKAQSIANQRQERLDTISDLVKTATSSTDPAYILSQAVNTLQQKFGLYHVAAYVIDPLHQFAIYREGTGEPAQKHKEENYQIRMAETSFGSVFTTRERRLFPNAKSDRDYLRDQYLPDSRSALYIPLTVGTEVLGIMDFESAKISGFTDEDINQLQVISDQLAVALSNATQSSKLQEYLIRQRSLYLITSNATSARDIPEALQIVVDGLQSALPNSQIMVFTPDQQGDLTIAASKGYEGIDLSTIKVKPGEGIVGEVASSRKAIRVEDTSIEPRFIPIDKDIKSEICIPINYRDELSGVLNIESKDIRAFDENDAEILATLGNTLGSIIASVRLVGQIRTQVQRQAQLYQITDKIRRAIDLNTIIQTSTTELCNALNARSAKIQIQPTAISESAPARDSEAGENQ